VLKFHRCENYEDQDPKHEKRRFGFIKDFKLAAFCRSGGEKASNKKNMLSSQPIGCPRFPLAHFS
jgi:hypothetical protein